MRARVIAGLLAAALGTMAVTAARAGTYEIALDTTSWEAVDLTPDDSQAPQYTVTSGSLSTLLSPVHIRTVWGDFEDGSVLPISIGDATVLKGLLYPGTLLIWKATGQLTLTAFDVGGDWDLDNIQVQTTFYSSDAGNGYSYLELHESLGPTGGTYQRISRTFDFTVEMHAGNYEENVPIPYEIGWFNQYQYDSFRRTPPIPEPTSSALILAGLGLMSVVGRRARSRA